MPAPAKHYVYILVSEIDGIRHYTGCTTNLSARLQKHKEPTELRADKKVSPAAVATDAPFMNVELERLRSLGYVQ